MSFAWVLSFARDPFWFYFSQWNVPIRVEDDVEVIDIFNEKCSLGKNGNEIYRAGALNTSGVDLKYAVVPNTGSGFVWQKVSTSISRNYCSAVLALVRAT